MVPESKPAFDGGDGVDLYLFLDFNYKGFNEMIKAQDLKKARMAKAPFLSKKEFAELAGVDQASICRWEQGKIPKTSGIFRKYLIFLGLLGGE